MSPFKIADENSDDDRSPDYFVSENRKYRKREHSRSDLIAHGRLIHRALVIIADEDGDRAAYANGRGFSKSDGPAGHWYASMLEQDFASTDIFRAEGERLAIRYRRQLPLELKIHFDPSKQILTKLGLKL